MERVSLQLLTTQPTGKMQYKEAEEGEGREGKRERLGYILPFRL